MSTNAAGIAYPGQLSGQIFGQPSAEAAYRDLLFLLVNRNTEWLDLGCGRSLIREWLPGAHETQTQLHRSCKRIVGLDLDENDLRMNPYIHEGHVGNAEHLPFPEASFNLVTAQMVVEHVASPFAMLKECARVLAPGGRFLFVTPNLRNILIAVASLVPDAVKKPLTARAQARSEHDIFPTRYRMNTSAIIKNTLSRAGMRPELIQHIDGCPDLSRLPLAGAVERWIRAVQPRSCRSDLLVLATKAASN